MVTSSGMLAAPMEVVCSLAREEAASAREGGASREKIGRKTRFDQEEEADSHLGWATASAPHTSP